MKYFVLLSFISLAFQTTYFGEYFQCSIFDKCSEEYQTCLADTICSYQMFASPCIDPCGVDYQTFFQQMRTYQQTHNDSENIALFPNASCNFTTCETNWINALNNTVLQALKQCEMQNCLTAYPSYTFIAHEYTELKTCNSQIAACEASQSCQQVARQLDSCIEQAGFRVDPRTNPDQYFYEHVNTFDNPLLKCLDAQTSQDPTYVALANCIKPIWNN